MVEIIDCHAHVDMNEPFGWFDPPEKMLRLMDEASIARAIVMTYADAPAMGPGAIHYVAESVRRYPDRLIGFARMNPFYGQESVRLLREAIADLGFKGVKFHQESITALPYNPAVLSLIRIAAEHRAPVLFHTGDEAMSLPLQIGPAAEAVPQATIIMGHCGGYYHADQAIAVAERHDNLLVDTSAIPYPEKIREAVQRLGPERVLFGSDGPGCNPSLELKKIELAGLSERERRLVLGENTQALLERVKHRL